MKNMDAVEAVVAGMKCQFSHAELRVIVRELQSHLSPTVNDYPPVSAPVHEYPREAPRFSA